MKLKIALTTIIFLAGVAYLLTPSPAVPDLTGGIRSNEPGDTWQHPDQKGFYTNLTRSQVIPQMQSKFSTSLFGINIPSYRLNYRPEKVGEFVRDQLKSYYLEEIVYPFKESLFVNGWEPANTPLYRNRLPKDKPQVTFKGVTYLSKVTLRPVYSPVWARLLVWVLAFPSVYLVYRSLKRSISA